MSLFKKKQLEGKVALYLGDQGQLASGLNDHRWYFTLDKEHYVGPYKRRIQAHRAYTEAKARQHG
jgi:hypothetical protein